MKNLLIVDGNSILNRAFYGIRPLTTADGRQTGAVMGFFNMLKRQMDALRPHYMAVAFDVHAPTFRHRMYTEYKAGRRPTPPELLEQFPRVKEGLALLGVPVLELPGWEADDLQGTVAGWAAEAEDTHAFIFSGDRDLLQLISPTVTVLLASNSDTLLFDRDAFFAKYGVEPHQLVEVKALMGDSSDHIPGVPGIGEKGALKLIAAFGSLEGVYQSIEDASITKGVRAKLLEGRESGVLSRTLATIDTHAPLPLSLEQLTLGPVDNDGLYRCWQELELSSLLRKFNLTPPATVPVAAPPPVAAQDPLLAMAYAPGDYTEASAEEVLFGLQPRFAVEWTETGTYFADGEGRYCYRGRVGELSPLFERAECVWCADGKRLLHAIWQTAPESCQALVPRDVLLAAYVLQGNGQVGIEALISRYLNIEVGEGNPTAHILPLLWRTLYDALPHDAARRLLTETELPLSPLLGRMERRGFRLDRAAMEALGQELLTSSVELERTIYELAGGAFNIQSPKQLSEVLFDRLQLPPGKAKRNKSGSYSTDAEVLEALRPCHPIVAAILEYRHLTKLYSTYAVGLLKAADEDGLVHTDFKQTLTATGRLSSAEPNLQNIPVRTEAGRRIRRCFTTAGEDYLLVGADYSQIELRLLAAMSGDAAMLQAFRQGADIHRATAAAVFGVAEEEVTGEMRKAAKAVNFGIVYGISPYALSGDLGCSMAEAKGYIESYFARYPGIAAYRTQVVEEATQAGYTETLYGRRRYIPELQDSRHATRAFGQRVAVNSPLQGSAADIVKMAMVQVDRRLRREGLDAHLVMQVHDELIVEAHRLVADRVRAILEEELPRAGALAIPLPVESVISSRWEK